MRLLNFAFKDDPRKFHFGAWIQNTVVDLDVARTWAQGARNLPSEPLPENVHVLIFGDKSEIDYIRTLTKILDGEDLPQLKGANRKKFAYPAEEVYIYPPLPRPSSIRDFYAFEQHVRTAHAIRQKQLAEEWFQFPVFYFSNPNAVFGPYTVVPYPAYTQELDYELEVACIIGKQGINLSPEEADNYILGYTVMNDWSARDIQRLETRVGLGPAKAKDFATSIGPWLVTPDELADRSAGRPGVYDLTMTARVNGEERSCGNWKDIHYSFGELISRASQGVYLYPGDVIGSGTVGSGCLLEQTEGKGPWLQPGDIVELEIERLGVLANRIGEHGQA